MKLGGILYEKGIRNCQVWSCVLLVFRKYYVKWLPAKKYGEEKLLGCLERNEKNGIY